MKNFFAKLMRSKIFIIIVVGTLLVFLGRQISISTLTDSAIVLGIGIDLAPEGFEISVHTAIPQASSETASSSVKYVVYTDTGLTISEALTKIGEKLGLILTLPHCNVIVASASALASGLEVELENLVDGWFLPIQAVIVATDEKPRDILTTTNAVTTSSASFINTVLIESVSFSNLTALSVQNMLVRIYSKSHACTAAYVQRIEIPEDSTSSTGSQSGQKQKYYELDLSQNMIFGKNFTPFIIDEELAVAIKMLRIKTLGGTLTVNMPDGSSAQFEIISTSGGLSFYENAVRAKIDMSVVLREYNYQGEETSLFTLTLDQKEELRSKAEDAFELNLERAFAISQSSGVDFMYVEEGMYQKFGRKWQRPLNFLETIDFSSEVNVTLKRG